MGESNNKKALKSGVWYTIGNFATKAMAFITVPIFTRLLTSAQVGSFSNMTSWAAILVVIVTLNLYSSVGVARFDFKGKLNEYISSNLILGSSVTFIFYILSLVFKTQISKIFGLSEMEIHVVFIYFLVYPATEMFQTKNRIEYKYKLSTAISLGSVVASTLISLGCVVFLSEKYIGRVLGYYVPLIIINIVIYMYIVINGKSVNPKYWKYAIFISLPLVWHTLSANLLNSSDKVMINYICGSAANAYYSVAHSCALIVQILWSSMNAAWSPWAFEKMDEENYEALRKASIPYILFFGFVVFGFLLVAPEVLLLMGGKEYLSAVYVIPPVMLSYVFQFVYSLYVNIEIYSKKSIYIAIGTTCAAVVNVSLNFVFIPIFDYVAAAWTTLIGYIVLFVIHYFIVVKLKKDNWYSKKFNFTFLFSYMFIMLGCIVLYSHTVIRYIIISLLFIVCATFSVTFRASIIKAYKEKSFCSIRGEIQRKFKRLIK